MMGELMPTRARMQTLEAVRSASGGFDPDAWHVMEARDNALISDEVLNGAGSTKFVYQFKIAGNEVTGISVIGARHLASVYGGLKHRMVASVQKIGALHTFTSFPAPGMPMTAHVQIIQELRDEDDYYSVLVEISDVKTGNSLQVEARENRYEFTREGERYDRPHYAKIAQAKGFRNGVLAVIGQDVQLRWKLEMLKLNKTDIITSSIIEEKRAGVLRFASARGLTVDRRALDELTFAQIGGLSDAAHNGLDAFLASARSLGALPPEVKEDRGLPPLSAERARTPPTPAKPERPRQEARDPAKALPAKPAAFAHNLVDAVGEVSTIKFSDPVMWAEAYADALASADAAGAVALAENNEQALTEARGIPAARELLPVPPVVAIPMPFGPKGADADAWVRQACAIIPTLDGSQLVEWIALNEETYAPFADSLKLQVAKALTARRAALGGPSPAVGDGVADPAAGRAP